MAYSVLIADAGLTKFGAAGGPVPFPVFGAADAATVPAAFAENPGPRTDDRSAGHTMTADIHSAFDAYHLMQFAGHDVTNAASKQLVDQTGLGAKDLDLVKADDCFAQNELTHPLAGTSNKQQVEDARTQFNANLAWAEPVP